MYMTAQRKLREKQVVLLLCIHDFEQMDVPLLDNLGITAVEKDPKSGASHGRRRQNSQTTGDDGKDRQHPSAPFIKAGPLGIVVFIFGRTGNMIEQVHGQHVQDGHRYR